MRPLLTNVGGRPVATLAELQRDYCYADLDALHELCDVHEELAAEAAAIARREARS